MINKEIGKTVLNFICKNYVRILLAIIALIFLIQSILSAVKYEDYIVDEVHYVSASKLILKEFFPDKLWNWTYRIPPKYVITNYLNLEHPPLGKYIIILSLLLLGDNPISWRIPGIIMGTCILLLVYSIGRKLGNELTGIIATIAVLFDPMINSMSKVAMLDIYLAFFTVLAFYLLIVKENTILASIAIGFALSVKLNGVIPLVVVLTAITLLNYGHFISYERVLSILKSKWPMLVFREYYVRVATFIVRVLSEVIVIMFIVIAVYLIINLPYIFKFGLNEWISIQVWMVNTHTTFSANHPAVAAPFSLKPPYFNWLFNIKPFGLTDEFSAHVNSFGAPLGAFISILFPILYFKSKRGIGRVIVFLWIWLGYSLYIILYLLGRKMQFIYYLTPITPAIDIALGLTPILLDEILYHVKACRVRIFPMTCHVDNK
ncbi:MAG TPA: phospholipid carrier-dependent glycosyltransferase [Desulfurococcales archaeon]|nr:phospholipid carrier-dependent glycosyltransferase [Desulfurococcales archaeon]